MFKIIVIISVILGSGLIGILILGIIDLFSNSKWFCEKMHWHREPDNIDGLELKSGNCPRCGKKVFIDEKGF